MNSSSVSATSSKAKPIFKIEFDEEDDNGNQHINPHNTRNRCSRLLDELKTLREKYNGAIFQLRKSQSAPKMTTHNDNLSFDDILDMLRQKFVSINTTTEPSPQNESENTQEPVHQKIEERSEKSLIQSEAEAIDLKQQITKLNEALEEEQKLSSAYNVVANDLRQQVSTLNAALEAEKNASQSDAINDDLRQQITKLTASLEAEQKKSDAYKMIANDVEQRITTLNAALEVEKTASAQSNAALSGLKHQNITLKDALESEQKSSSSVGYT